MKGTKKAPISIKCRRCGKKPETWMTITGEILVFDKCCGLIISSEEGEMEFMRKFDVIFKVKFREPEKYRLPRNSYAIHFAIILSGKEGFLS